MPWHQRGKWRTDIFKAVLAERRLTVCRFILKNGPTVPVPAGEMRTVLLGREEHYSGQISFKSHRNTAIMRALGFSSFTLTDTLDELKTMIRDAVSCHFDATEKPSLMRLHMLTDEVILA